MKTLTLKGILPTACLVAASISMGLPVAGLAQTDSKTPTSDNQKNDKSDVTMTADIRKAIMADKSLSTAAHNVKIITQSGKVTLRGSVQSQAEHDTVLAKATDVAGAGNVVDDMKIKPPKNQ